MCSDFSDPNTGEFLEYSGNRLMMRIVFNNASCNLFVISTRSTVGPNQHVRSV